MCDILKDSGEMKEQGLPQVIESAPSFPTLSVLTVKYTRLGKEY